MPIAIALIIVMIVAAGIGSGIYFYNMAISTVSGRPAPKSPEKGGDADSYDDRFFELARNAGNFEDVYMQSRDGLLLHGILINECNISDGRASQYQSGKWAILCHGYTGKAKNMSAFAEIFATLGFSILAVDLRGHGESEGKYRGMGWHDSFDVCEWVGYLEGHHTVTDIALFGISMGGAAVMMAAGHSLPDSVKAVVEDCGYSSIRDEMRYNMKLRYDLPSFPLMNFLSLITKKRAGFSILRDGDAAAQLRKTKLPVLFIHGEKDGFVPFYMFKKVYDAAAGPKEKFTVPAAGHGKCFTEDPDGYRDAVFSFLYRHIHI